MELVMNFIVVFVMFNVVMLVADRFFDYLLDDIELDKLFFTIIIAVFLAIFSTFSKHEESNKQYYLNCYGGLMFENEPIHKEKNKIIIDKTGTVLDNINDSCIISNEKLIYNEEPIIE